MSDRQTDSQLRFECGRKLSLRIVQSCLSDPALTRCGEQAVGQSGFYCGAGWMPCCLVGVRQWPITLILDQHECSAKSEWTFGAEGVGRVLDRPIAGGLRGMSPNACKPSTDLYRFVVFQTFEVWCWMAIYVRTGWSEYLRRFNVQCFSCLKGTFDPKKKKSKQSWIRYSIFFVFFCGGSGTLFANHLLFDLIGVLSIQELY